VEFDASLLVIVGIFWVTYFILRVFFFTPMMKLLDEREERVESAQAIYDEAISSTSASIEEERQRLAEVRRQALAKRDEQRREANEQRGATLAEVNTLLQEKLATAATELDAQVATERATLEDRARDLAAQVTRSLLGRTA
jgi:F-type H+-transporting ATPase subunit b